jgi:diaminohydroxyphosphoribosylaminopyrimidine deaminase/5-amino-6-(5-phosphoribosylamino)uracil reductase
MSKQTHQDYMRLALQLAARGRCTVSPNPMVGCVIVKNNHIIGTGYHQKAGGPHAEVIALQAAGDEAKGATAYITLEPCNHFGRTPPCSQALIKAGIQQVFAACTDPNPRVSGQGFAALRTAGIDVECGLLAQEAQQLNEVFFHYIEHRRPFVYAKWAMSLDGKTVTQPNDSPDISCHESRQHSHQLRQQVDAILIGANTAIHDDPQLTVRHIENSKQPLRIILASKGELPAHLKLWDISAAKTCVMTTAKANKDWIRSLQNKNINIHVLPVNENGTIHLPSLLDTLGKMEITSLLVEGGMTVLNDFFTENLVNKIHMYLAPVIIGSLKNKQRIFNLTTASINHDLHFTADYTEKNHV